MAGDGDTGRCAVAGPGTTRCATTGVLAERIAVELSGQRAAPSATQTTERKDATASAQESTPGACTMGGLRDCRVRRGTHAVFIGDSISEGFLASDIDHRWTTRLSAMFGWTEHNYAVGGTGLLEGTTVFTQQVARAVEDTSYDHSQVATVLMVGGVNDGVPRGASLSAALRRAGRCVTTLRQSFPNARVMVGVGVSGSLDPARHSAGATPIIARIPYYSALESTLGRTGVVVVPQMWKWIGADPTWQNPDRLHPSDAGHARIAELMSQVVQGTFTDPAILAGGTDLTDDLTWDGGITDTSDVVAAASGNTLTIRGKATYTIPFGSASIGTGRINDVPVLRGLPKVFRTNMRSARPVVGGLNAADPFDTRMYRTLIDTGCGVAGVQMSARFSPDISLAAGDRISIWLDETLPLLGVWR